MSVIYLSIYIKNVPTGHTGALPLMPAFRRQEQAYLCKLEDSLVFIVNFKIARAA